MFEKIKSYYERGLWTLDMVRNAVTKGRLTRVEFYEITGVEYD